MLSLFARLSIQPKPVDVAEPKLLLFCTKHRGFPSAGLSRWQPTAPNSFEKRSAEPASQQQFWFSIRLAHRVSAQAPSTSVATCCSAKAGPDGWPLSNGKRLQPSTEKGVGFRRTKRRSHAARSSLAAPHCHSPPTSGTAFVTLLFNRASRPLHRPQADPQPTGLQPPFRVDWTAAFEATARFSFFCFALRSPLLLVDGAPPPAGTAAVRSCLKPGTGAPPLLSRRTRSLAARKWTSALAGGLWAAPRNGAALAPGPCRDLQQMARRESGRDGSVQPLSVPLAVCGMV